MGFRLQSRVSLLPGLRVNLGARAARAFSIGGRGAWYTVGPRGRRVTLAFLGVIAESVPNRTLRTVHERRRGFDLRQAY